MTKNHIPTTHIKAPTPQEQVNAIWELALEGKIDYSQYRKTCTLESEQCKPIQCTDCKYFVTPPTPADLKMQCKFCDSQKIKLVTPWRPAHEVPTEDGVSSFFKGLEIIYLRMLCSECDKFTDIECPDNYDLSGHTIAGGMGLEDYLRTSKQVQRLTATVEVMNETMGKLIEIMGMTAQQPCVCDAPDVRDDCPQHGKPKLPVPPPTENVMDLSRAEDSDA